MKYKGWIRGTSVLLSFIGSLLIALELIATSSADYKNLVDGVFQMIFPLMFIKVISKTQLN